MPSAEGDRSERVFVRSDALLTAEVDGEVMAMSIDRGVCYGLNRVGSRIWELLAEPQTVNSLCEQLLREFEVEPAECLTQVGELIDRLKDEGLVTVRPH